LLGDQCYFVALPWLILQFSSAVTLGTVMMAGALPRAVLMLAGGVLSDRVSARRIMLCAAVVRAACVGTVGTLAALRALGVWEIYGLVIVFGIADAFALPAESAFVPSLVSREQLVASTSLQQVIAQLTGVGGPVLAGLLIARLGAAPAFWADAVSFLFVIGALITLPDPPRMASPVSALGALAEGIAHVRRDAALSTLFMVAMAMNLCASGPLAVGVAYLAKSRLHSSSAYGMLMAALAAGYLAGAIAAGAWNARRRGVLILGGAALLSVCLMGMALTSQLLSAAAVLLVMGAIASLVNVHISAWVMQRIETAVRGRVSSVLMLSSLGIMPLSMAVAGYLAAWGASALFVVAGAALLMVTAAAACSSAVRRLR
jgi:MFS family permease